MDDDPRPLRLGVVDDRVAGGEIGGAKGARTPDLLNAIQTLFQLSYSPAPERER
jgi:hypothetical protein